MHPGLLFPLAMITPILLMATLFLPAYGAVYAAVYIVYAPAEGAMHPLADKWLDVFYIFETFGHMIDYWVANMRSLGVLDFALPGIMLPAVGVIVSLWLTWQLASGLINLFRLSTSGP